MPDMERVTPTGLLVMTAEDMAADREAWLRLRRWRSPVGYCIGSSEVPNILEIKGAGTGLQVWMGKVRGVEQPDNPAMMWGRLDEDTTARYWRDRNRSVTAPVGLICNEAEPWRQTTLDRLVLECPLDRSDRKLCALEVKHRGPFGSRRWHRELPDDVLAQICDQIAVTGLDHIHYAVRIGGNEYRQGVVRRSENEKIIEYSARTVRQWRADHLFAIGSEREPVWPIAASADKLIELDKIAHPERVGLKEITDDILATELGEARAAEAAAKACTKQAKAAIAQQADGARWVKIPTDDGPELVYEYRPGDRTRVDLDRLRERYPHVYADPEVVIHSTSWSIVLADAYKVQTPAAPEE